jgi:hypothetical protein
MKHLLRLLCGLCVLATNLHLVQAAPADTNETVVRLSLDLRDGSHVVGKSLADDWRFHSDLLGDLKLAVGGIRAIEIAADGATARLTATNGDVMAVQFLAAAVRVETGFGKTELPVKMIRSLKVTTRRGAGNLALGLVGLWSGDGNAADAIGGNNGTLRNVSFTDGVAGQAFAFAPNNFPYGTYTGVQIPDRPAFALTHSLTIAGWVRPRGDGYVILCRGDHRPGMDPYTLSMQASHVLRFQICGPAGESAFIDTQLPYCEWTQVTAVLDGDAGTMLLYTNGVLSAQTQTSVRPLGDLIAEMSPGVGIGNVSDGGNNFPFNGDLDEIALYSRALSADEANVLYAEHAANAGSPVAPYPTQSGIPGYPGPGIRRWPGYNPGAAIFDGNGITK